MLYVAQQIQRHAGRLAVRTASKQFRVGERSQKVSTANTLSRLRIYHSSLRSY